MVKDPPHMVKAQKENRRSPIDFTGIVLVATGLGALQIVMDKGQREDWFGSNLITSLSIIAVCAILGFIIWEWNHRHPIVNLKLFKNPNFAVTNVLMLLLGVALFGSTVLIPQFLQLELGYTAQMAGEVLTPGGIVIMLLMPLVGFLISRVDARYMIAFGFIVTSFSLFHMTNLYLGIDYRTAMLWRVYQAAGMAFMFVPINTISYVGTPPSASNQVSAMVNLMRNIGGSIGISAVTTLLARYQQVHHVYLASHVYDAHPRVQDLLAQSKTMFATRGAEQSTQLGYARLAQIVNRQAAVLAYVDTFWIMGTLCLIGVVFLFFLKKNKPGKAAMAH
jgi:DHA2 family multidrug resistance protein